MSKATDKNSYLASQAGKVSLGNEISVNRFGLGTMRLTGQGTLHIWDKPKNPDSAISLLRRAVELGVNFIDTSDAYGPEIAENLIAEALHPYPEELIIATKGGLVRDTRSSSHIDGSPEHLKMACENSLKRLKLESIDLYQLHFPDENIPIEDSVGALSELKADGKIRHIGLCNVSVEQLERARKITPIVSVQARYNLQDRATEEMVELCDREELAFVPWYPLGTGDLTEPGGTLDEFATRYDATPAQIALAWLLQRSSFMLPIAGTSSVAHLEENLAATAISLNAEDMTALSSKFES